MKEQRPKATQPVIFTVVRLLQFLKAYQPICLTEEGIKISFKLIQYEKAEESISVTEFGIFTETKLEQFSNRLDEI